MSSRGLNVCTLSGNVAAEPEVRQVDLKSGGATRVADIAIYVDRIPKRSENDSFIVNITVWEGSAAWRKLQYIKKGSLVIATGAIDASPYVSKTDDQARAGLQLKAMDIFLDSSPRTEEETPTQEQTFVQEEPPKTRRRSKKEKETASVS